LKAKEENYRRLKIALRPEISLFDKIQNIQSENIVSGWKNLFGRVHEKSE
jgi:hypothetical protein